MENNIYNCINISNVINKLKINKTKIIGSNIYVNCPFCQKNNEKIGYMKLNALNNLYICNNCESAGTSIELYAKMKYISTKDAFKQLLRESPILDNIPYIYNNTIKDESYRDLVYSNFLEMQKLDNKQYLKLINMNFKEDYIIKNRFKSIENNEYKKKKICKKLLEQGLKLDGIPGFFQDEDFRWTFKSHKGIFIPVIQDNKIQGLRILLDREYRNDTANIWFSSSNEYNGTKATNWPMILKKEESNWIDMYNSNKEKTIIIATEMILAHKIFNDTNMTVIGIPNNIDKDWILEIVKRMNAKEVFLYVDKYTILHTGTLMQRNIIEPLESEDIKVNFRVALLENEENRKEKKEYVA